MWPSADKAHQIAVKPSGSGYFRNIPVADVEEAMTLAHKHSKAGDDVYFACAEYKTGDNRRAENVFGAAAFWLDFDCGPDKFAEGKGHIVYHIY